MTDKRATSRNFSRAASSYNAHATAQSISANKLGRLIQKYLHHIESPITSGVDGPIEKVADLGCGTGMLSRHLVTLFPEAELTVVDIAPDMLTRCQENLKNLNQSVSRQIRYTQADVETDLWGENFSLVASNYCFQWTDPARSLASVASRLWPGGFFAFAVPCRGTFPELHTALHEVRKEATHGLKYHSPKAWAKMLHHAGFEVLQSDTFTTVVPFADSASALRSFGKIGASFSRHADYQPLDRRQIVELLRVYDRQSGLSPSCPFSRVTYKTLLVLARLRGVR